MASLTTLVVTNDFPPRIGGIEGFVAAACEALGGDVVVLTRREADARATEAADARLPYEVVRLPGPLLPTRSVARAASTIMRERGISRVLYGAAAPLGLLAPALRRAGAVAQLGLTHGHEVWWATLPGARGALRRIVDGLDHVGVISGYTEGRIAARIPYAARAKLVRIPPPVDLGRFRPVTITALAQPVVVAAGRLVAQKGVDRLLDVWPLVRAAVPGAELRIVGEGPQERRLAERTSQLCGVSMLGPVPYDEMPQILQTARVFALPVRTRWAGLNPEGLGRVFLEAAASGLPVVVGRSGGAPETVLDGLTGSVVDDKDPAALVSALVRWLGDPEGAAEAGEAGRRYVAAHFGAASVGRLIRQCLDLETTESQGLSQ